MVSLDCGGLLDTMEGDCACSAVAMTVCLCFRRLMRSLLMFVQRMRENLGRS